MKPILLRIECKDGKREGACNARVNASICRSILRRQVRALYAGVEDVKEIVILPISSMPGYNIVLESHKDVAYDSKRDRIVTVSGQVVDAAPIPEEFRYENMVLTFKETLIDSDGTKLVYDCEIH